MNTKNITITTESGATFAFAVKVLRAWTEEETVKREWGGSFTFTRAKFDLEITVPDRGNLPPCRTEYSMGAGCLPDTVFLGSQSHTGLKLSPRSEDMARKTGNLDYWRHCFDALVQKYNPAENVIASLCLDAQSVEYDPTLAQWMEEMGETCIPVSEIADRMKAYTQCQETLQWLRWAVQTQDEGYSTRLPLLMEWANEQ